ncbi:MAG: hypothetical protein GY854_21580, partial [Deltaproteobacteria bacterium]|nr:hypothetical protein [Deltaproteobacteria bacterium]
MSELQGLLERSFPLPIYFGLECHPDGVVAQDSGGIMDEARCSVIERPACSNSVSQRYLNAVPHSVMEEDDSFNEDLHPG